MTFILQGLEEMKLRNFSYSKVLRNKEILPENHIPCSDYV